MSTENRSSNTDMVSVPREWLNSVALLQMPLDELQEQAIQHLCEPCDEPTPQHPAPIAWMVGTAFWWTKEEAERDAAQAGLPIVGLGPMAVVAPAEQHQGEPVQAFKNCIDARAYIADLFKQRLRRHDFDQYITERLAGDFAFALANWLVVQGHADPAEAERLRAVIVMEREGKGKALLSWQQAGNERDNLSTQLADAHALLQEIRGQSGSSWLRGATQHKLDTVLSASAEPICGKCHGRGLLRIATVCGPADKSCPECASADPSAPTHDPKLISIVHTPPAEYDEP